MLAKKKILCYTIGIERKREKYYKKDESSIKNKTRTKVTTISIY